MNNEKKKTFCLRSHIKISALQKKISLLTNNANQTTTSQQTNRSRLGSGKVWSRSEAFVVRENSVPSALAEKETGQLARRGHEKRKSSS